MGRQPCGLAAGGRLRISVRDSQLAHRGPHRQSSASPVSGMTIATLMATSAIFLVKGGRRPAFGALAITIGGVVCIAASNSGDTSQDLKTGYLDRLDSAEAADRADDRRGGLDGGDRIHAEPDEHWLSRVGRGQQPRHARDHRGLFAAGAGGPSAGNFHHRARASSEQRYSRRRLRQACSGLRRPRPARRTSSSRRTSLSRRAESPSTTAALNSRASGR